VNAATMLVVAKTVQIYAKKSKTEQFRPVIYDLLGIYGFLTKQLGGMCRQFQVFLVLLQQTIRIRQNK
jgi:hypothetical protein